MKKINFLLALIFFISSCGFHQVPQSPISDSLTVDWTKVDQKPVPKIEDLSQIQVGPSPLDPITTKAPQDGDKQQGPIALILGPGGYRVLSHISLLKEFNLKDQKPQVIVGHGLASVIAAYYAFGYAPDYIEWKFFKFINALEDEKIFSAAWLKQVKASLLEELKNKRIEEGSLTLIVPIKDRVTGKLRYKKRGPLLPALMANLDHRGHFSKKSEPAFTSDLFNRKSLRNIGIEKVIAIDLVTSGISWVQGSGFLNGVYEKGATAALKSREKADIMMTYQLDKFALDDRSKIADLVFISKNQAREKVKEMIEQLRKEKDKI